MGRRTWSETEIATLERFVDEDDWLTQLKRKFPDRTTAALRGRMQRLREDLGISEPHDSSARFHANSVNGTRMLYEATIRVGMWS